MTKGLSGRLTALLLSGWLLISPALAAATDAPAEIDMTGDYITITSREELLAFASFCALDTWSRGKTVELAADLDLDGEEFAPIPTFGGTFLGGEHTISGLCVTGAGSAQGLFRYIQPGGVVQDLTVEGTVAPGGTRSAVGGIAGDNAGTLQNCAFRGTVRGDGMVGGIAGRNGGEGQIVACTMSGSVTGESAAGGIAGRSMGLILACENNAGVNLTQGGADLADAADGAAWAAASDERAYRLLGGCTDAGGIVGWSDGVVQECVNNGAVGYPHVGYNIGGIAGRQSGRVTDCVNNGVINGRKDVGGIVGQGEPCVVIDPREDAIERLRRELDALDQLINKAIDDAQSTGNSVSVRLEAMGGFAAEARRNSQQLLSELSSFADGTVGSVNTLADRLAAALEQIVPALDDLSDVGGLIGEMSGRLGDAMDALNEAVGVGDQAMEELRAAVDSLRQAQGALTGAVDSVEQALDQVLDKSGRGSAEEQQEALDRLKDSVSELEGAAAAISGAIDELREALKKGNDIPGIDRDAVLEELGNAAAAMADIAAALGQLRAGLPALGDIEAAHDSLENAFGALKGAADSLDQALGGLQAALGGSGALSGSLSEALGELRAAADTAAGIGALLSQAVDTVSGAVSGLTGSGSAPLAPLSSRFHQAGTGLFNALGGLSGEMERLNGDAKSGSDAITEDLRAINEQFRVVIDAMLDTMNDVTEGAQAGLDEIIQDTSEEDIAAAQEGKVSGCQNTGPVEGDRNVGGVIGAMSIEFDLDPEDEATDFVSFGATYETKAVLLSCINYGAVSAKKDCVGGLAGRMDLGTALACESYGPVESAGGDYVGGIAGYSGASVRGCWAKCALSGGSYVGGVAGWAGSLRDCRAIATITEGAECLGAIAGNIKAGGVLDGNCFVDTGVAGVDGVSYAGQAEPVPFEAMAWLEGVPEAFTAFTLTLRAEGRTVAQLPFLYGDDLSLLELPPVPEREGCYGVWPEFDYSGTNSDVTLDAVYNPWVTLAASAEKADKLSLALAEGRFTNETVLHVDDITQDLSKKKDDKSVTWSVTLTGAALGPEDEVPLRLLSPMGGDADVWQYVDSQWVPVEVERSGRYLLLTMKGPQGAFFIQPRSVRAWMIVVPAVLAGTGAAIIAAVAVRLIRDRRRGGPRPFK